MRPLLLGIGALVLALGLACASPAATPTPAPPTATPTPPRLTTPAPTGGAIPEELKGTAAAMAATKSFKFKATSTSTRDGTPVPEMSAMGEMTGEIDTVSERSHTKIGDMEIIIIGKTTYTKFGKDLPWTKTEAQPQEPEERFKFEEKDFASLSQVAVAGTEPCPRGGLCRVYTAVQAMPDVGPATVKFWIGVPDNLIYKSASESTSGGVRTVMTTEFYDYNVPVAIKAPIP